MFSKKLKPLGRRKLVSKREMLYISAKFMKKQENQQV